jgi:hypothetical protein
LLGRVKQQLARELGERFDDQRDEFVLTHANATLDVAESLESRGITSDCTMTLLHLRTGDRVAAPKAANKVTIQQPLEEVILESDEPCEPRLLPRKPAQGY